MAQWHPTTAEHHSWNEAKCLSWSDVQDIPIRVFAILGVCLCTIIHREARLHTSLLYVLGCSDNVQPCSFWLARIWCLFGCSRCTGHLVWSYCKEYPFRTSCWYHYENPKEVCSTSTHGPCRISPDTFGLLGSTGKTCQRLSCKPSIVVRWGHTAAAGIIKPSHVWAKSVTTWHAMAQCCPDVCNSGDGGDWTTMKELVSCNWCHMLHLFFSLFLCSSNWSKTSW